MHLGMRFDGCLEVPPQELAKDIREIIVQCKINGAYSRPPLEDVAAPRRHDQERKERQQNPRQEGERRGMNSNNQRIYSTGALN